MSEALPNSPRHAWDPVDHNPGLRQQAEAAPTGFQHPWEARAFAIVVKLAEAGCFTWAEWVSCLSEHIRASEQAANEGARLRGYPEQWVDAAEALLVRKGVTSAEQLRARRLAAWPVINQHPARQKVS
ncbi:MAG: nitrile hydratase accessory protein [Betaproteobacteria bacterium]